MSGYFSWENVKEIQQLDSSTFEDQERYCLGECGKRADYRVIFFDNDHAFFCEEHIGQYRVPRHVQRERAIAALKEGDEVAVSSYYHGYKAHKVSKVTPTGIVVLDDGRRFKEGREMGQHAKWDNIDTLAPLDDEIKGKIRRQQIMNAVNKFDWNKATLEQLEGVYAALTGNKKE